MKDLSVLRTMRWLLVAGAVGLLTVACDGLSGAEPEVSVSAEVTGTDLPFEVSVTQPTKDESGHLPHGVIVSWRGEGAVVLDDARFTHHVEGRDGDLVTAGRGCGANWDESGQQVMLACTADLRIVTLASGESHEYPVTIWPEVGPLSLERGTYVVEETIAWWHAEDTGELWFPSGDADGTIVIRLTYEVR